MTGPEVTAAMTPKRCACEHGEQPCDSCLRDSGARLRAQEQVRQQVTEFGRTLSVTGEEALHNAEVLSASIREAAAPEPPAELVETAARAIEGLPYGLGGPGSRAVARHALAAVLPEVRAQAQQDLITDLLAQDLWSVRYELNEYPIRAVPQSALLGRRNRLARLTATAEEPTT